MAVFLHFIFVFKVFILLTKMIEMEGKTILVLIYNRNVQLN